MLFRSAEGTPLATLMSREKPPEEAIRRLNRMLGINSYRTIEQDPGFGIRQITDIAIKALSPGINDPTTAVNCLDYLGLILRVLVRRRIPSPFQYQEGRLRVIARGPAFDLLLDQMFHEIRLNAGNSFFVVRRMLEILEQAASPQLLCSRRHALWQQVQRIIEHADEHFKSILDRQALQEIVERIGHALGEEQHLAVLPPLA